MNNENFHPIQNEPPITHALHHWDEEKQTLSYEYNGVNVITIEIQGDGGEIGFRHGSDGSMKSIQYLQQIYVSVDRPVKAIITFMLIDGVNMRASRANHEQAILGQLGRPLIDHVNGLYDTTWDLLIDWHGCEWKWLSKSIEIIEEGNMRATAEFSLTQHPLFINLRPQYYRKHLGYKYHLPWLRKPKQKAIAGWCSWEAYRRNISLEKIDMISSFMEEKLKDYGLEYIQVDDGYQKMPIPFDPKGTMKEGWFACDETRFPHGHEGIVESIQEKHLTPAIWVNANITNPEFPTYNQDSIIWHESKPLKGEWIDFLYNCSDETLKKHIEPLFKGFRDVGYQYVKIDAIRHLLFDGLHECVRLGIMSNDEAEIKFRVFMLSTRKGLGEEAYYLASWGEMGEVVGVCDACRISMDANPTWAGIRMQLFESARWYHTQRILFLNDPDHVCVRTKNEWAKSVLSLISLSGELYMLSDTPDAYSEDKMEIIRKTLPPLATRTAETGPLSSDYPAYTWTKLHGFAVQSHETPVEMEDVSVEDVYHMAGIYPSMHDAHPFSTLWSFHLAYLNEQWCVMARIATVPLNEGKLELKQLGLKMDCEYLAFDFWKQQFLGVIQKDFFVESLNVGECQIVALRENKDEPQLIGSTRHVSMDAISVKQQLWKAETGQYTLSLESVVSTKETYTIYCPSSYTLVNVSSNGKLEHRCLDNLIMLDIEFSSREVVVDLKFQMNK